MGLLEGYNVGAATPLKARERQEKHDSRMQTEEQARSDQRLNQLETLQRMRGVDQDYDIKGRDRPVREAERRAKIEKARAEQLMAEQDREARKDLDDVSRLETAYRTGNQVMLEDTLEGMSPGTREALLSVPQEGMMNMLGEMRGIATNNLDQLRKYGQTDREFAGKRGVERVKGREARATGHQTDMNRQVLQEQADLHADHRARVSAGPEGMIASQKIDDPKAGKAKEDEYIDAALGALNRKGTGTGTVGDVNRERDRATKEGMSSVANSLVSEYSGGSGEFADIDSEEEWAGIPGWSAMRTQANRLSKKGYSGSDIHDYITGQYLLLNKDRGFIRMPVDAQGDPLGKLTARSLLQESRDTGEPIEEVVRRYGRYIEHNFPGNTWDHQL